MASAQWYAASLRSRDLALDHSTGATAEPGVAFFVPQLAKVKTSAVCQAESNQHLLFDYEHEPVITTNAADDAPIFLSYRKQGNQTLYSEENLQQRKQLMDHKEVLAAINRFWDTFPSVRRGNPVIQHKEFIDVFIKLYKALVAPQEFSVGEARRIVEKDWHRDVGAQDFMSKTVFQRSLFEVTDLWTDDIGVEVYVSFLSKLFDRVTVRVYDAARCVWLTTFAELDSIHSMVEPSALADSVNLELPPTKLKALKPPLPPKKPPGESLPPTQPTTAVKSPMQLPKMTGSAASQEVTTSRSDTVLTKSTSDLPLADTPQPDPNESQCSVAKPKPKTKKSHTFTNLLRSNSLRNREEHNKSSNRLHDNSATPHYDPHPILLSMPSIYLSPDLTHARGRERTPWRRHRDSPAPIRVSPHQQRSRRITY